MKGIPSKAEIYSLVKQKNYEELIEKLDSFIKAYSKVVELIIKLFKNKDVNHVIIPELGGVNFMRLIQEVSGNHFNMHPGPMSGNLERSKYFELIIREILEENLDQIKEDGVLRIGFIDEVVSGSSLKDFRRQTREHLKNILLSKRKSFFGKKVDFFEELRGISIEFYFIGVVGLLRSWFTESGFKMEQFMTKNIRKKLRKLKGEWTNIEQPVEEFLRIVEDYSERIEEIYLKHFDSKVTPEVFVFSKEGSQVSSEGCRGKERLSNDCIQLKIFNISLIVSLLFTEDVKEFSGVEYNFFEEFIIAMRSDNKLFKLFKKKVKTYLK